MVVKSGGFTYKELRLYTLYTHESSNGKFELVSILRSKFISVYFANIVQKSTFCNNVQNFKIIVVI